MHDQSKIALACPYCDEMIYQPPGWFRQTYSTCPFCDKGLTADQFAGVLNDLEQAMDGSIEAMLTEPVKGGCCGSKKKDSCCGSH